MPRNGLHQAATKMVVIGRIAKAHEGAVGEIDGAASSGRWPSPPHLGSFHVGNGATCPAAVQVVERASAGSRPAQRIAVSASQEGSPLMPLWRIDQDRGPLLLRPSWRLFASKPNTSISCAVVDGPPAAANKNR